MKTDERKVMKLDELKAMLRAWKKTKSVTIASDICAFLVDNLELEDEQ